MTSFIVYQLSDHSENINSNLQTRMRGRGYHTAWTSDGVTYRLPSNSMWKVENFNQQTAIDDISTCLNELNAISGSSVRLVRCVAVPVNPWAAIPGE